MLFLSGSLFFCFLNNKNKHIPNTKKAVSDAFDKHTEHSFCDTVCVFL